MKLRRFFLLAIGCLVLAVFVGIEVITKVPPTLHTPLMSGSNAISGITLIGAILSAGSQQTTPLDHRPLPRKASVPGPRFCAARLRISYAGSSEPQTWHAPTTSPGGVRRRPLNVDSRPASERAWSEVVRSTVARQQRPRFTPGSTRRRIPKGDSLSTEGLSSTGFTRNARTHSG